MKHFFLPKITIILTKYNQIKTWTPPFSRSPESLEISVPISEITFIIYLIKLLETKSFPSQEGSDRKDKCFNLFIKSKFTVIISLRGRFFSDTWKTQIQTGNFQIETMTVVSIFTSLFSPFVNLCEVISFCIRILTQFRNQYLSKNPFYKSSWRGGIFVKLG